MKIVIVGPGAVGCLFAAFLTRTKEDVWLLDKDKENASKLNESGIALEGVSGSWQIKVKVTVNISEIGKTDLYISHSVLQS